MSPMKLSTMLDYSGGFLESVERIRNLEQAGLDMVWVAEAYGFDAVSLMGFLAAKTDTVEIASGILPIYTRTPTLIAMTAAGVDALSGGRCVLGLGASGPQVIEGFHGVQYDKPLARTREIIDICRKVWKRDAPVTNDGPIYPLPLPVGKGTGLGKPLKLIAHPVREQIPIYVAALGHKNVALTAELADGWLPIFYIPEKADEVFGPSLREGFAKRDPSLGKLEISAGGLVCVTDDADQAQALRDMMRPMLALYIGGMGARGRNFYNALARRYGYEKEAEDIQDLYLDGKKQEAAEKIPEEMLRLTSLVGSQGYVRERIAALAESGVTNLNIIVADPDPVQLIEKLRDWTS
ncbi:MAG: LLM class F420-dependent oxidoreductase [Acidimicrobiales bacterium]